MQHVHFRDFAQGLLDARGHEAFHAGGLGPGIGGGDGGEGVGDRRVFLPPDGEQRRRSSGDYHQQDESDQPRLAEGQRFHVTTSDGAMGSVGTGSAPTGEIVTDWPGTTRFVPPGR